MSIAPSLPAQRWRCRECGDSSWSADLAEVEEHLARVGVEPGDHSFASVDYCPECYWELVTGSEPSSDVFPATIGRTFDIDSIPSYRYEVEHEEAGHQHVPHRPSRPR